MPLIINNRLMARVGAIFMRNARELAQKAYATRMNNKYQIINGFLLRASGRWRESNGRVPILEKGSYIATVMDTPGFILFGGALRIPSIGGTLYGIAAPVGIRDDFQDPGTDASFEALESSSFYSIPSPSRIRPSQKPLSTDWFPNIQTRDWFMGLSRMDVPLLQDFPNNSQWYLDDDQYFDYSCIVALTGSIVSLFTAARTLKIEDGRGSYGAVRNNYFYKNQYAIDENDLIQDWKLFPRRLVPVSQSSPTSGRLIPKGVLMNGFAFIPASVSPVLSGTDTYCHSARTFRQYQQTWGVGEYKDFDRNGEQGLLIAVGEQDRSDYDESNDDSVFATTRSLRVIIPADIEQEYLRPFPEFLKGNSEGKPNLPNFGIFLTPTPVEAVGEFVVFSAYTTYINRGESESENDFSGDAWSILTTLPSGETVSLRADWAAVGGEIPTGIAGEFMQPWIVGGCSIPGEDGAIACCLVWEQTYVRGTSLPLKGQWAIYSTDGSAIERNVFDGFAPVFSLWMKVGPTTFSDFTYDIDHPFSSAYYAGNNKIVTACIDYPPQDSDRAIRCAVFDVETGEVAVGGVIARSSKYLDKCFVTVVQPFQAARSSGEEVPATLLATIVEHRSGNSGAQGKVYLSVDGGESWREYITDAGAQAGAVYVGNKLWRFDLNRGLDGRSI